MVIGPKDDKQHLSCAVILSRGIVWYARGCVGTGTRERHEVHQIAGCHRNDKPDSFYCDHMLVGCPAMVTVCADVVTELCAVAASEADSCLCPSTLCIAHSMHIDKDVHLQLYYSIAFCIHWENSKSHRYIDLKEAHVRFTVFRKISVNVKVLAAVKYHPSDTAHTIQVAEILSSAGWSHSLEPPARVS
jgi:hypothetical protein